MNVMPYKNKAGEQIVRGGKLSWRLRWETRDRGTGKREHVYETFHGSKREAERYWIKREGEIRAAGAGYVKPVNETLGSYLQRWLADYGGQHLKATTLRSYAEIVRVHIAPALGAVTLADFTAADASAWQAAMARKMVPKGDKEHRTLAPISPRRVAYARSVLHAALEEAVRLGLIPSNPVAKVRAPRQAPRQVKAFTFDEIGALARAVVGQRMEALLAVAWQTGMRLGELLALTWEDIDFAARTLRVDTTLADLGRGNRSLQDPKTERSIRTIALSPSVVAALRVQKRRQAEDQMAAGARWGSGGFVFTTKAGRVLSPANVRRDFYRLQDKAGVARKGFHSLRHTKATVDKLAGVDIAEIAANLGHESPSFTAKQYAHVLPESQRAAADRFEEFVRGRLPKV